VGRTKVLATTMIMMAVGTFCIGIIPGHETIGIGAPILLLLARLVQGFSTGGEYGGAMTFIAEYTPDKRRGLLGSWPDFGTLVGFILGAGLVSLLTAVLSEQDMLTWGWRIPFLIALPLGIVGLYLRMRLGETPAFTKLTEQSGGRTDNRTKTKFHSIFVKHWRSMLLCVALVLAYNVAYYMFFSYMPTYLTTELSSDIGETESSLLQVGVMSVMLLLIIFHWPPLRPHWTPTSDLDRVFVDGSAGNTGSHVDPAQHHHDGVRRTLAHGTHGGFFAATMTSALPALFPTEIRQGALSISFNVSVSLFGGTVASVMTALIAITGDLMWPAYYLMAAGVIGGVAIWLTPESANKPLMGAPPAVEAGHEPSEPERTDQPLNR
jgi:MHS family proline/betaine transporter-like MFS transporter